MNILLNKRRKVLKGETERSLEHPDNEEKLRKELAKAFKKNDQKLQLRNWLLENEMKNENFLSKICRMMLVNVYEIYNHCH